MSYLDGDKLEEPEFRWLKEKAGGKRYIDTHFYESFFYDGVEYSLYDSVYLQVESEQAPSIGRLVKIWEEANKSKKITVQWFFRPSEVLYYLGDTKVLENELFFASGCGIGLANIAPLEAIVGKCNIVCISKDFRNPKPSDNDIAMADYVFYRFFDVQSCVISDQLDGTIGKLQVEFVFNRKESVRTLNSPKFESNKNDARNAIACKDARKLVNESLSNISLHPNGVCDHITGIDNTNAKQVYVAEEELPNHMEYGSFSRESTSGLKCSNVDVNSCKEKAVKSTIDNRSANAGMDKLKERESPLKQVQSQEKVKSDMKSHGLNDISLMGGKLGDTSSKDRGKNIDKLNERESLLKQVQSQEKVKSDMKSHGLNDISLMGGKLGDTSSKDRGKNIDVNSSKDRQAVSTIENKSASGDNNDRCEVNFEIDNGKDKRFPLKHDQFGKKVTTDMKSHCSVQDREAISTIDYKNVSNVKNVECKLNVEKDDVKDKKSHLKQVRCEERITCDMDPDYSNDTSLKRGKFIDRSSKNDGKTSVPSSNSGNNAMLPVNDATSCDAKLESEIDKGYGGLTKDVKLTKSSPMLNKKISKMVTTSCPKTLESEHVANFVSPRIVLDSTKCWNASGGKPSKSSKNKSDDDFEGREQVASDVKLSSNIVSQLSACVYPLDGKIDHGPDSFKRKDSSLAKDSCLGDVPYKKATLDDHNKPGEQNSMEVIPKLKEKSCGIGHDAKHAKNSSTSAGAPKRSAYKSKGMTANHAHDACEGNDSTFAKDLCAIPSPSKKAKLDGSRKISKLTKNDLSQNSKEKSRVHEEREVEGEFEVSPRHMIQKRTWLKLEKLSWENIKRAHNEGKLVLLHNLDPTLTSAEVQDIIWHAFGEDCVAKMVQHTAISSPHNGQALVIFNSREVAERVVKQLDDKCLILLDQRPLVGCTVLLPELPSRQTAFVGHLYIDKVRRPTQREMKEAVSTSHYSQSNTIEYEMAMEWRLLQSKSNIWWQELFELQKMTLKKLMANLRLK